jgi:hypothetical protein
MSEINFQVNEFRTYKLVREGVSFGFIDTQTGGYSPALGETFKYDGSTVILRDGREFSDAPQLRSAIREGWISQVGSEVTAYRPKAAGIQVRATEHRGTERPVKTTIETTRAEERAIMSVEDRRRRREETNAEATRKVPLQSREAQVAIAPLWSSGDEEIDNLADVLDSQMWTYEQSRDEDENPEDEDPEDAVRAQAEADILAMLNSVEDDDAPARAPRRSAPRTRAAMHPVSQMRTGASANLRMSMPVENQDARPSMPIVREDAMENAGDVVGRVSDQNKAVVEREREFALDVAQAKPENKSPAPRPRFGGVGAIIHDEQRDMGAIALSSNTPAIKLNESAAVTSSGNEMIRMADTAQVGPRKQMARAPETDQGVAVGRILSPTHQTFTADARNTSPDAIQRTAKGRRPKVERYEVESDQGDASEGPGKAKVVATGDVQEARTGDTLEELLPDAATPAPEVHRRPEEDPAYAAVRMFVPDFEWNKDRPMKERVAEALKHVKNPLFVKGILAVETAFTREEIKKGLASLLERAQRAQKAD